VDKRRGSNHDREAGTLSCPVLPRGNATAPTCVRQRTRFGFLTYGHVGIGVLPERQEIFIRFSCCLLIVHECLGTRQSTTGMPFGILDCSVPVLCARCLI
jgi:hypothetical protein